MPTIPETSTFTGTSADVLNGIRNSASQNYRNFIPVATPDADCIKSIGSIIMQDPALQNEFISVIMNRIGSVIITSKQYSNPWAMFKNGVLNMGETVEEIFVNLAHPKEYDATDESTLFKREIPDVRAAFHVLNYRKYYKTTVNESALRQAFLSVDGITSLISKITEALYTGANYDEFLTMKYMLAKHMLDGHLYPVAIPTVENANMQDIVSTIKGTSNSMEFLSDTYNLAGVKTFTPKDEQYFIINSLFDAKMNVQVLATAFNMDKAEFMGHRVLVDSFGKLDNDRLAELFSNDPNYVALTAQQLAACDSIPVIIVDKNWFMIFDQMYNFTEQFNPGSLYWNYFYHTWKVFSISPFANNALFIPGTPTITSVTITPATATVHKGGKLNMNATVVATNFATQSVNWTISGNAKTTTYIDNSGNLTVGSDETATAITVTATSTYDNAKTGTATITLS